MDSSVQQLSDRIDAVSVANIQIRSGFRLYVIRDGILTFDGNWLSRVGWENGFAFAGGALAGRHNDSMLRGCAFAFARRIVLACKIL